MNKIKINENGTIDLHTHSTLSDGRLSFKELIMSAKKNCYSAIGLTDHVYYYNYKEISQKIIEFVHENQNKYNDIVLIPGVEITFATPKQIETITKYVRSIGTKLILVHGEASFEETPAGTNDAAIDSCVDVLAHPSYITDEQAKRAFKNNVSFELSARSCYCYANPQIVETALKHGANIIINSDGHFEDTLLTKEKVLDTAQNASLTNEQFACLKTNTINLVERLLSR